MVKFVALQRLDGQTFYVNSDSIEIIDHPIKGVDNADARSIIHFASGATRAVANPVDELILIGNLEA